MQSLKLTGSMSGMDFVLVNGGWQPVLDMTAGKWQRWRMLHSGIKRFLTLTVGGWLGGHSSCPGRAGVRCCGSGCSCVCLSSRRGSRGNLLKQQQGRGSRAWRPAKPGSPALPRCCCLLPCLPQVVEEGTFIRAKDCEVMLLAKDGEGEGEACVCLPCGWHSVSRHSVLATLCQRCPPL